MTDRPTSSAGQHPSGLSWIHADAVDPLDSLAAMFDRAVPSDLQTADFTGDPGAIAPHCHTEDIASYIVSGNLAFDVGPGYADRLVFGPGDCVFVPAMLPHIEEVLAGESLDAIVASLVSFETEPV